MRHALDFRIGDGRYAWPVCHGRGGPWHVESGKFADDPEAVTCLRCLDRLTRPVNSPRPATVLGGGTFAFPDLVLSTGPADRPRPP